MIAEAEKKFEERMTKIENLSDEEKVNGKWLFSVLEVMHSEIAMLSGMVCALIDKECGKE